MAWYFIPQGVTGSAADVDATPKALRGILYDAAGNVISKADRGTWTPGTSAGLPAMGAEYKLSRALRVDTTGSLRNNDDTLYLTDAVEGSAVDTNKWIQTTTTMTIAQANGVITFNSGSSVATTVGAMHTSHRMFPYVMRSKLCMRTRARMTAHSNNNLIEMGFGAPATATTAAVTNGAFWRKDGTGQLVPVISINSSEILGTAISDATFRASVGTSDYALFEVFIEDTRVRFFIYTQTGALVSEQDVEWTAPSSGFAATHLQAFHRTYNNAGTGAAVQLLVSGTSVFAMDSIAQRTWPSSLSGQCNNMLTSPTAYTQNANWSNSAAPTTRTLSNTAAAETTLGGLLTVNSIAGGNTDYIMFGFQVPSPFTFYFTGIRFDPPLNQVVAVATTATVFSYAMAFNSSAVSLATGNPYPPMRMGLGGFHTAAVALAANAQFSGPSIQWYPQTPIAVHPGRFLHLICRELVGTATATETYAWNVAIDGYFE